MAAAACSALLALALLQGVGRREPYVPPPPYPYVLEPVDLIVGHLTEGRLKQPSGVFFDAVARELFVADGKNGLIGIFDPEATPLFAFGGPGTLVDPRVVRTDAEGTIYVLDADSTRIQVFSYRGEHRPPRTFRAGPDDPPEAGVDRIAAFTFDAEGRWYVADSEDPRVVVYGPDGAMLHELRVPSRREPFVAITSVAVSGDGLVAVVDMRGPPVSLFNPAGDFLRSFGARQIGVQNFTAPVSVTFDEMGYLFVVDLLRHDVKIYDSQGRFRSYFGGWFSPETAGRGPGEMLYPCDLAVDAEGNRIYVAERFGNRVQIFRRVPREDAAPKPRLRIPDVGAGD